MNVLPQDGTSRRPDAAARLVLAALVLVLAAGRANAEPQKAAVRLVVDYGDGVQIHFTSLAWRDGMTVVDALAAAGKHPHGVTYAQRGSGSAALITSIGDVKNQGGGGASKNWLFSVNDKPAEVGAGAYKLKAGDTVLWRFDTYD